MPKSTPLFACVFPPLGQHERMNLEGHLTPPAVRWKCLLYRGRFPRRLHSVVRRRVGIQHENVSILGQQ